MTTPMPISDDDPAIDRLLHAWQANYTSGLSPAALTLAYLDWLVHLSNAPGKQFELWRNALQKSMQFWEYAQHATINPDTPPLIEPSAQDRRFSSDEWQHWPFNLFYQSFLLTQQWWQDATTGISGVSAHHKDVVSFAARQILDALAPSNFAFLNPEVLRVSQEQGGANFMRGMLELYADWQRTLAGEKSAGSEAFMVGKTVGITPGKVIYRNRLIELIQYTPTTETVYAEPILIVPAWIMKYYILDLSPHNSLVKYLVDHGYSVFMISWKNPGPEDRDLGMNDYLTLGAMTALDVVSTIIPGRNIHTVGYCIGGSLLSMAAAAMGRDHDNRLQSVTLFATQTDFTDVGELSLFIDESQLAYLQDKMWEQGYLRADQMSGAFQMLRSNDLIWSRMIHHYMLGERDQLNDLMAWNTDTTRMPYRMHSEYLSRLFLKNDLFEGRYQVTGRPISLSDIHVPLFVVGTQRDHVAPWRSVYKLVLVADAEFTFLLTSGGHNAGIVSEPGHARRSYQITTRPADANYIDPDTWQAQTPVQAGSWWPAWHAWLSERSGPHVAPPPIGAPEQGYSVLADAPGTYVLEG